MTQAYAKSIDVGFEFVKLTEQSEGRFFPWSRIPELLNRIEKYDEIIWMDSDATVINFNVNIFDVLKTAAESKWNRDKGIQPTIYTLSDKPSNDALACSGIFLVDCSDKDRARKVLTDWWNDIPDKKYYSEFPWDQIVWNDVWVKDAVKRSYLRVADLWSFAENEPNQVFIHIIGAYKQIRLFEAKKYMYRLLNKSQTAKRIGIFIKKQDFYSNGLGQNAVFLKLAFEACGYTVELVSFDIDKSDCKVSSDLPYFVYNLSDLNLSDFCFFVSTTLFPPDSAITFLHKHNIAFVNYIGSNVKMFHNEHMLYESKTRPSPSLEQELYKYMRNCWLSEAQCESSQEYLTILNKNKVNFIKTPLVWNPVFIQSNGKYPLYEKRSGSKIDIVIIEPNLNYCKSSLIPLMACEKVYIDNPERINKIHLFNVSEKNKWLNQFTNTLTLGSDKKIVKYTRMRISEILEFFSLASNNSNNHVVFLSHQIDLPLNYAYFDIMYAGFPFVHNSPTLRDHSMGYSFNESDIVDAANKIIEAVENHDVIKTLPTIHNYLDRYSPYHESNIQYFKKAIQHELIAPKPTIRVQASKFPHVVSYDNAPNTFTERLLSTLMYNNWEFDCIGRGDIWKDFMNKFIGYKKWLETRHDDDIVLLIDSRDVLCLRTSQEFMSIYSSLNSDFIVSMEPLCDGKFIDTKERMGNCQPLTSYWKHHGITALPIRKYVNSGLMCGKASSLRKFLTWSLENGYKDDQLALADYMNTFPDRVKADIDAKLIHTCLAGVGDGKRSIDIQNYDSPSIAELSGRSAFFIHIPGLKWFPGQLTLFNTVSNFIQPSVKSTISIPPKLRIRETFDINSKNIIRIVNLKRREDRKKALEERFKKESITAYKFIEAVDGKTLQPSAKIKHQFRGNDHRYRKTVIACALSHISIWKNLVNDTENEYYIIFEDDVRLCPGFKDKIEVACKEFDDKKMGMLFIGGFTIEHESKEIHDLTFIKKQMTHNEGCHGYILRKSSANAILRYLETNGVLWAIDKLHIYNHNISDIYYVNQYLVYAETPPIHGNQVDSDIQKNYECFDFTSC